MRLGRALYERSGKGDGYDFKLQKGGEFHAARNNLDDCRPADRGGAGARAKGEGILRWFQYRVGEGSSLELASYRLVMSH